MNRRTAFESVAAEVPFSPEKVRFTASVDEVVFGVNALVTAETDCHEARLALVDLLNQRYGIEHSTLQVDHPLPEQVISPESLLHRPADL